MTRLYVGNLSWNTTQESLRAAFEADGRSVKDVLIMTDRETGRSRGFGFVEMNSKDDADAAIRALDGANVDGRQIKVNEARAREAGGGGGGGGGGYGGGGGGRSGGGGGRGGRGGGGGGYGGGGGDRGYGGGGDRGYGGGGDRW